MCKDVIENGTSTEGEKVRPVWEDGTSAYTIKRFGVVNRYDLRKEFPALTLRKTALKSAMDEILWIWQKKSNNIHDLHSHIWDSWADENGSIGKAYGYQLGVKHQYKEGMMDQVDRVLYDLKNNPYSRRIMTNIYVHEDLHEMNLYPCAYSMTFNVTKEPGKDKLTLNAILNQRSQDILAANNWNVCQYSLLLMMIAQCCDMEAGELVHVIADCHIYDRHVPVIKELISRTPYPAPTVKLNPNVKNFYDFTTDDLIVKAAELNDRPSKREMDVLLNTGEMISMSLLAMAIQKLGFPVVSLTGWQIGLETNSNYSDARIKRISGDRLKAELDNGRIVIVAGFQGINKMGDVTTLGRGGSDTTAVAIAATLGADLCQIYTDVDGVYTADPRIVKNAHKLDAITYDEMLELASLGAQVLHNRSVEMAKKYNVDLEVVSSFTRNPGTKVKEGSNMEKLNVSGVARDNNCARVAIINLNDTPGTAFKVFSLMAKHNVNIDIILQSVGRDNKKSISFTIRQDDAERVAGILRDAKEMLDYEDVSINTKVAKVSIVGAGMASAAGVASKMFEALAGAGINIRMISTSEIKISVLINEEDSEKAVKAIHDQFFGD